MRSPRIEWHQLWYPGRRTPFTADEMARAGSNAPGPTMVVAVLSNVLMLGALAMQLAPRGQAWQVALSMSLMAVAGGLAARWLWWQPWRRPLMQVSIGIVVLLLVLALFIRWQVPNRDDRQGLALVVGGGCAMLPLLMWFLVIWRAQQIEGRLRELAEREQAIEMARRLTAAQLEPHFLFNTLASLQHWVQTKDDRAAPLLSALTGYLRATLPMFKRPLLALADELLAVERYLQVMQARMGSRLTWHIHIDPALHTLQLPPGVLLTLVENAVMHGLEPQLAGGEVHIRGTRQVQQALIEVSDNGAGPPAELHEGVGLSNIRQRLQLTSGPTAALELGAAPGGGFRAQLLLPFNSATP